MLMVFLTETDEKIDTLLMSINVKPSKGNKILLPAALKFTNFTLRFLYGLKLRDEESILTNSVLCDDAVLTNRTFFLSAVYI